MSRQECIEIASTAEDYIEDMVVDLISGNHLDNKVCLGTLIAGNSEIQVQLVITRNPDDMLDD